MNEHRQADQQDTTHEHDLTYENEQSTVTLTLKEYDRLRERQKYITDKNIKGETALVLYNLISEKKEVLYKTSNLNTRLEVCSIDKKIIFHKLPS